MMKKIDWIKNDMVIDTKAQYPYEVEMTQELSLLQTMDWKPWMLNIVNFLLKAVQISKCQGANNYSPFLSPRLSPLLSP